MHQVRDIIANSLVCTVEESGGSLSEELTEHTVLLESGLDSLGFAILVSRLEDELGFDPFSMAEEAIYPTTFGEFVSMYEQNQPC